MTFSDVLRRADSTDYVGELEAEIPLRITDQLNGSSEAESGTVEDFTFEFPVPCTPTLGDPNRGSTCQTSTTADALTAGMVTEAERTIWEFGKVKLFDGGVDGLAATQNNTLFAVQGVFVP